MLGLVLGMVACKDKLTEHISPLPTPPFNPFDTLTYPNDNIPTVYIDSATYLGVHNFVFAKRCAQPACHDGTFEPDFRTVQSAYAQLVLHGISKNYTGGSALAYRVKPNDTTRSMLWHRITRHNPPNFELMPSSGNRLPQAEIDAIGRWIMNGARDLFGNLPTMQSLQPTPFGVIAFDISQQNLRVDSIRGGVFYQPFMASTNDTLDLWFGFLDQTAAGDTVLGDVLTYNKIKFSTNPFDFSTATEYTLTKENLLTARYLPYFLGQRITINIPYTHHIRIAPRDLGFVAGNLVYMRLYVRDADHSSPTELPQDDSQPYLMSYFSIILQ